MEWYYYLLIITGLGLGTVVIYILFRRYSGYSIPYLSNVVDPLLLGTNRSWDDKDSSLRKPYSIFDSRTRKQRIQDRTTKPVKNTYTRQEYINNKDNIQEKYAANPDMYDIIGVDTPHPPTLNERLTFFTGTSVTRLNYNASKNKIILASEVGKKGSRIRSTGVSPDVESATIFGKGVYLKITVDNRKRLHEQKVRPMPYGQGKWYPEYKAKNAGKVDQDSSTLSHKGEEEWASEDPMELSMRDVKVVYVEEHRLTGVKKTLPPKWHKKIVIIPKGNDQYDFISKHRTEDEKARIIKEKKFQGQFDETWGSKPDWAIHMK